ncbi:uncharacterized LOC729966 homolog [Apodemus sylvaticus]|uniref:uncharacterized LOC729966 homolog n=1 Tax=Apodemus sylvaticus TaxID=10129 RepID=UPI0022443588|nr:uncharacterized LOC729966 homolog [Apodemus sylvaticus]
MAGSRLLALALALLLLARPADPSVVLAYTGVAFTLFWEAICSETNHDPSPSLDATSDPASPNPDATSDPASPSPDATSDPASPSPEATPESTSSLETISPLDPTASLPTSGLPSSQPTTMSQSTNLAPQGSPTASSSGQDAGNLWIPTSHRNPGVVIVVCLLLSVFLIGSVLIAVRHSNREAPPFHNLDTVSMGSVNQRLPFADRLQ